MQPPPKHTKFDELIADWEKDDQRRVHLEESRRWLAEAFPRRPNSDQRLIDSRQ